jgi:hypothetical protein
MKKMFVACALVSLLFISSCSKSSNGSVPPSPLLAETWPQNWILTIDHDATFYKYLHIVGIVINRNLVDKSYSMTELAKEKECNWEVKSEGQRNGRTVYSFHLAKNKTLRWIVGKTATVGGMPEWYLGIHNNNQPPNTDDWLFYVHSMPNDGNRKFVTIESVTHPGWYLDNKGHTLTANGVRFSEFDDAAKAPHFERH